MVSGGGGVSVYGGESVRAAEVGDAIVSAARGQSDHALLIQGCHLGAVARGVVHTCPSIHAQ